MLRYSHHLPIIKEPYGKRGEGVCETVPKISSWRYQKASGQTNCGRKYAKRCGKICEKINEGRMSRQDCEKRTWKEMQIEAQETMNMC